ncbi:DUF3592 domain-containing protein [Burkholderia ubonensis]|uniref:DUF3592 domain-containing protein n=1 Tax=Burkholderia ubonensis subsp. mesacidophila TaxID=265293 RepID=A0A2A4EMM4_9BURK|nr:DUF3592 domain-containing protein [Burkholderia ubonensis]PCE21534.1 hypothetical protein BZL54_35480 [Burkholderia ubonensis subsp. mesacidophila]
MFKAVSAILIGIGMLIGAAISVGPTRAFLQTSIVVPGRVVWLNAGGSHPQIEFTTRAGETVSYPQGGMISSKKVGQRVAVRYLPDAPARSACVDEFTAVWNLTIVLACGGLFTIVCGLSNLPSRNDGRVERQ